MNQRLKEQEKLVLELWKKYGFVDGDVYRHKQQFIIVTRPGIEKIEAVEKINISLELVGFLPEHVAVKCIAKKGKVEIETFGSAKQGGKMPVKKGEQTKWIATGTTESWYLTEIAEKRAKARAVLQILGLYKHGFFSEDESEDFKDKSHRSEITVSNETSGQTEKKEEKKPAEKKEAPKKEEPKKEEKAAAPVAAEEIEIKAPEEEKSEGGIIIEPHGDKRFKVRKNLFPDKQIGWTIEANGKEYVIVDKSAVDWIIVPNEQVAKEEKAEEAPAEEKADAELREATLEEKLSGIKDGSGKELTESEFEKLRQKCAKTGIGMHGINLKNVETRLNAANSMKELKDAWTEVCVWGFGINKEAHAMKDKLKEKLSK